jgi:hypothetical protein
VENIFGAGFVFDVELDHSADFVAVSVKDFLGSFHSSASIFAVVPVRHSDKPKKTDSVQPASRKTALPRPVKQCQARTLYMYIPRKPPSQEENVANPAVA